MSNWAIVDTSIGKWYQDEAGKWYSKTKIGDWRIENHSNKSLYGAHFLPNENMKDASCGPMYTLSVDHAKSEAEVLHSQNIVDWFDNPNSDEKGFVLSKFGLIWNMPSEENTKNQEVQFNDEVAKDNIRNYVIGLSTPTYWYGRWEICEKDNGDWGIMLFRQSQEGQRQMLFTNLYHQLTAISREAAEDCVRQQHEKFNNAVAIVHAWYGYYFVEKDTDVVNAVNISIPKQGTTHHIDSKTYQETIERLHQNEICNYFGEEFLLKSGVVKHWYRD